MSIKDYIFKNPNNPKNIGPGRTLLLILIIGLVIGIIEKANAREVMGTQQFIVDDSCSPLFQANIDRVSEEFSRMSVAFVGTSGRVRGHQNLNRRNDIYCSDAPIQALTAAPGNIGFIDSHVFIDEHGPAATTRSWYYLSNPNVTIEWDIWFHSNIKPDRQYAVIWHEFGHVAGEPHSDYTLDLMYRSLWVDTPSMEDIQRVVNRYGQCDRAFYTDGYKKILIPRISYKEEDVQVTLKLESEASFEAIEISDSECD
jgi:hypothetical protein